LLTKTLKTGLCPTRTDVAHVMAVLLTAVTMQGTAGAAGVAGVAGVADT
jgi:hypothetical protein